MKVIIAGSRDFTDKETMNETLYQTGLDNIEITEVVSGTALGADVLGEQWRL